MKLILIFLFNFSPSIYGDFYYFPKENKDSILIHIEIPIHILIFTKYQGKYSTDLEISYVVYDDKNREAKGERFMERIEITKPVRYLDKDSLIVKDFNIVDDLYRKKIVVNIKNLEKEWRMQREFKREGDLVLGDIVFTDNEGKLIHRVENLRKIYLVMEIYSKKDIDENYKIEFLKKNKKKSFKGNLKGRGNIRLVEQLDLSNLVSGDYKIRVYFEKSKDFKEKILPFYGIYIFTNEDFYMVVDALYYFADPKDIDSLRLAPINKRKEYWEKFWRKRDPSPDTPQNEFEEEFLRRFYYANENFGVYTPGYRTARGRIYILYGEPDEIERHPFEVDSYPYEIWYYYNKKLKFVFVDKKGVGEYELVPSDSYYYISPWR